MILCLNCATAIDRMDTACPSCGEENNPKAYYRIIEKMNQYILFGYSYRKIYEKQYAENGKIATKCHLDLLSEPFAWVGLAVLSGLIGGASWDFVKYLSKKIASQFSDENLTDLVSNEIKLKQFSEYIFDYHQSFRGVKDDVRDAIFEEMIAHIAEDLPVPMALDSDDKAAMFKLIKKSAKKANEKHRKSKLSNSIVKGLWGKVEISIDIEITNGVPNKTNSADAKKRHG